MILNYNDVFQFMKEFGADLINRYEELIIDESSNTYISLKYCKTIDDVKTHVVYSLCRPIGKGLEEKEATRLLGKVNKYFNVKLTRQDMLLMYQELCYESKLNEFGDFIKRGFPIKELNNVSI